MTFLILSKSILMNSSYFFYCFLHFSINHTYCRIKFGLFTMNSQLMFRYFIIYFLVEFAIINKNTIHFFELLNNKIGLSDDRLHCNTPTDKHLINSNKFLQLRIIDKFLEFLNLVL